MNKDEILLKDLGFKSKKVIKRLIGIAQFAGWSHTHEYIVDYWAELHEEDLYELHKMKETTIAITLTAEEARRALLALKEAMKE